MTLNDRKKPPSWKRSTTITRTSKPLIDAKIDCTDTPKANGEAEVAKVRASAVEALKALGAPNSRNPHHFDILKVEECVTHFGAKIMFSGRLLYSDSGGTITFSGICWRLDGV